MGGFKKKKRCQVWESTLFNKIQGFILLTCDLHFIFASSTHSKEVKFQVFDQSFYVLRTICFRRVAIFDSRRNIAMVSCLNVIRRDV